MNRAFAFILLCLALPASVVFSDPWIRPDTTATAKPIWGHRDGLQIGLWPTDGPRGLIRIYTPYLNQPQGRIIQFIAIEPVVNGIRDLSEMQSSAIDHKQGKQMWTADQVDLAHPPEPTTQPARGIITQHGNIQELSLFLIVEPFDNGARPIIKVTFTSDHPHEVQFQTFAAAQSKPMESCILTATMGNYARLRHLHLKDRQVDASTLYTGQPSDTWNFYPHQRFTDLATENGFAVFSASGDADVNPTDDLGNWRYTGKQGRQYWRTTPVPGLVAVVNARNTFWGTHTAIPGGIAFENFELNSSYLSGESFFFSIEPEEEHK